ncbi:uncharacterized protein LOC112082987 [Eutrema salsugineum]|uniref:uncharacterized protein LOC112082987 n=1 Tax=Eutrema salsugineum TaxID=72664 RepID=UPI000CED251B|nr:uncharacterized protein LOC112082987 [Eutrema salsugineum]
MARLSAMPTKSSDSQRTISDPPAKAKQGYSSPEHTRSRPFHLSLTSKTSHLGKGKMYETGESSEAGSSAKKALTFEPAIPIESNSIISHPKLSNAMSLPPLEPCIHENWYEQTLEEGREEMNLTTSKPNDEQLEFPMEEVMETGGDLRTFHNVQENELLEDEIMEDPAVFTNNETIEGIDEEEEWMNDDDLFDEGELDELLKDADSPEKDQNGEDQEMTDELAILEANPPTFQAASWFRSPEKADVGKKPAAEADKSTRVTGKKKPTPRSPAARSLSLKKRNFPLGRVSPKTKGKGKGPKTGPGPTADQEDKPKGDKGSKAQKKKQNSVRGGSPETG